MANDEFFHDPIVYIIDYTGICKQFEQSYVETRMSQKQIHLNEVHRGRGTFRTVISIAELARHAREYEFSERELAEIHDILARDEQRPYVPKHGVNPEDLSEAGWGVVVPESVRTAEGPAVLDALKPLIDARQAQVGDARFQLLGYRPGENKDAFLRRHRIAPSVVDPDKIPYYLMLVGTPEDIPFRFQHELSVHHAVGRLDLQELDDYRSYARAVLAYERSTPPQQLSVVFAGVVNPDDPATCASTEELVLPLAGAIEALKQASVAIHLGERARRMQLLEALRTNPSLFFVAGHGHSLGPDDPDQRGLQGALVCQDWGGRMAGDPAREHLLAGDDLSDEQDLRGMIGFFMSCFSAGTPEYNEFRAFTQIAAQGPVPDKLSNRPFVAHLPQRMLARGALAVIGHIERAWDRSFRWSDVSGARFSHLQTFESTVTALLEGKRVGFAMEYFSLLYAGLVAEMVEWQLARANPLASMRGDIEWAYRQLCAWDARNYVILGDPAVRLRSQT